MSEQTSFDAAAFTALGTSRDRVSLPSDTFDGTINLPVMHLAVKAYLANQRQGTASTKTRGLVIGGNQKPWKQKGTGRARQGSIRAPNWPGGGTVFGPHGDRNYDQDLPRKVKQLARRSALNARAREACIFVVDQFNYDAPRTKSLLQLIDRVGATGQKVLVLTDGVKPNVYLSGRNVQRMHVMPFSDATTYHILWSDVVLIEGTAIGHTLAPVVESSEPPKTKPKKAPAAKTKATTAAVPAKKKTAPKKKTSAKAEPAKKKVVKKSAAKKVASKVARKKGD